MPIVTVYHRVDFASESSDEISAYFAGLREILARELGGDGERTLDPSADFELYLTEVGHRVGEHVTWDISIDVEAYDFDYRISNAEERARAVMNGAREEYSRRFGWTPTLAVWLKLVTASWVQSEG